jgi:hypothetical protein
MVEKFSNEELQRQILETDLETRRLGLERQKQENEIFIQTRDQRERVRKSHQIDLAKEAALREALQRACLHRQGGGPEDRYEGDGKSALVLSRVFFSNNFLIQCPRCDLALQRPHPKRKSTKPIFEGETQAQIKERLKLYAEDVARYEGLLREAKGNKLRPMLGPTWEFADEEGNTFIPEPK